MTTSTAEHSAGHPATHDPHGGAAPAHGAGHDILYVKVAIFLAVVTGLEVMTYFLDFGPALLPVLIVCMVVKFVFVALFFMHLRHDAKLFGRFFWAGIFLALFVYLVALSAFSFWG